MKKNQPKLKISFVYDDSLDGSEGVAQYVKTLGSWLSGRGHEVSYLVGQTKIKEFAGGRVFSLSRNVQVSFNGNKLSIPLLARNKDVTEVIDEVEPDILHVQMPHSPMMAARVIAAKSKKTKVLGTFHVYPASRLVRIGSKILAAVNSSNIKKIDKVVAVSEPAQQFAKQYFGIDSEVVPNMVGENFFVSKTPKQSGIVFLGRLVERKGARQMLLAFSEILKQLPDQTLTIAGDGPQRSELQKLAIELGISKSVHFAGFVSEQTKVKLFSSAEIACFPSLYGESFGIVLIEAMAAGSGVVIAGDNPGYRSVMGDEKVIVNPNDTASFADKIVSILRDKKLAAELHRLQKDLSATYSVDNVGKQIERIYYGLIDN